MEEMTYGDLQDTELRWGWGWGTEEFCERGKVRNEAGDSCIFVDCLPLRPYGVHVFNFFFNKEHV